MKKFAYFLFSLVFIANYSYSQGEVDALKYSRNELYGTARSMAMANAFGALGGDITGVSINPAGIAVYRSSEVVGTLGFQQNTSNVGDIDKKVNDFNLHNLGFVGYFPLRNDVMPMINFGFSYNKQKTFNNDINALGDGASRMIDYIVDRTNGANNNSGIAPDLLLMGDNLPDPFIDQPWLSVLGFNSKLMFPDGNFYNPLNTGSETPFQEIILSERGYIDNYDFTIGTTINNVLNLGLALNISDINHSLYTDFLEDYNSGGYTLNNEIITNGAGVGAKLGVIYRPVNAFRIGLAYHTPTWYSMSEIYKASIDDDLEAYVADPNYEKGRTYSAKFTNYYDLKTPDKWVLSGAAVLGNSFILSADYELMNYQNMKLSVPSGSNSDANWYDIDNNYIKKDFKAASTVKVGAEYRFTPQFSGRLGYAWIQNPYDADFSKAGDAAVSGSNTIFRIEGDTNYFTGGFGYRFTRNFYADLAVVYQTQEDQLYPFPNLYNYNGDERGNLVIDASPFTLKNTSVRGLLTLGYRF